MEQSKRPWKRLSSTRTTVNDYFHYRLDDVELPNGERINFAYQDHPGGIIVVPVTDQGQVVMVRQYRYPVQCWSYEVPAGILDGEAPDEAARRELQEEIGGQCRSLELVGSFCALSSSSNSRCFIFLATGVQQGQNSPELTESLEVIQVGLERALEMARSGEVSDAHSALALLLCEPRLRRMTA